MRPPRRVRPLRKSSIVRRLAVLGGTVAAVTALVSGAVPLLLLGLRLRAADQHLAEHLAAAVDAGIERERVEQPTLERAAREAVDELTLGEARIEVWGPVGLIVGRGSGASLGKGETRAENDPLREKGRLIVRRKSGSGLVIAVAVASSFPPALRREMVYALLFAVVPLSLIAGGISIRLARRALAPLEALARDIARQDPAQAWTPVVPTSSDAEIVRLAASFNETGVRLVNALSAEREFASYAAHALRTPLMRLAASAHSGSPISEKPLWTLQRLVDSLLVFVRSEVRLDRSGTTVNVADVLRRVAEIHAGGSRLLSVVAPDEVAVRGDEDLLTAAIEHLVENAVAYSRPGTAIGLSAREADGRVTVWVEDEGPGISAAEAERIFEPFVRGAASAAAEGSGLGLALVRRIAVGHGGTARVTSLGEGSRFELVLPAWKPR